MKVGAAALSLDRGLALALLVNINNTGQCILIYSSIEYGFLP